MWSFQTHRNQQKSTDINRNQQHGTYRHQNSIRLAYPAYPEFKGKGPAQFPPEVRLGAIP